MNQTSSLYRLQHGPAVHVYALYVCKPLWRKFSLLVVGSSIILMADHMAPLYMCA